MEPHRKEEYKAARYIPGCHKFVRSSLSYASREGEQAGGIPCSDELQAASVRGRVCVSEAFPQGAVPPAGAPLRWEGVWKRCGVLGVLWKKVRGCLAVGAVGRRVQAGRRGCGARPRGGGQGEAGRGGGRGRYARRGGAAPGRCE